MSGVRQRAVLLAVLGASWLLLVVLMVQAYRTMPSAAALADARHVKPPLPRDLLRGVVLSFGELALAGVLLWPSWRRGYGARALAGALVLATWFVFSVPLSLTNMELLHRRWLALLVVLLLLVSGAALLRRLPVFHRQAGGRP